MPDGEEKEKEKEKGETYRGKKKKREGAHLKPHRVVRQPTPPAYSERPKEKREEEGIKGGGGNIQ